MGTAACGARQSIDLLGKATILAAALLLASFIYSPAGAQSKEKEQASKPTAMAAGGAKSRTPPKPQAAAKAKDTKATAPRQRTNLLDPAKVDPLQFDPLLIDPKKLDAKSPNSWVALGRSELLGGNFAGGQVSLERAVALGEQHQKKAAVAAAAVALGIMHTVRFAIERTEAGNVGLFGGRPDDQLTNSVRNEFEKAKASFEKALALQKELGRKDAMAAGYSRLGDLYTTDEEFDQAQAMLEEALVLNKALQRKKEMAANYRDLAMAHRYDLDHADALLKEAIALHEGLGLKEEMAADYEELAAINTKRGEPYEAERFYKQALSLASKRSQISTLRALERLYQARNDPGQAADMKEQARALDKEREKEGGGRMIFFSSRLGLYVSSLIAKEQIDALEKAIPMEKTLGHRTGLAASDTLLGMHYGQRARIDEEKRAVYENKAEVMLRDSLALNQSLGREDVMALAYRELAELLDRRGNASQAEATLKNAVALHQKLGEEKDLSQLYWSLGYNRNKSGDKVQACAYWRQGLAVYPDNKMLADLLSGNKCTTTP
jgi:tetratricopeptide (TPR) repeat protein